MALAQCQLDAYQTTLSAQVLACDATEAGFRVRLDDTVLYPTGGGQPHDLGRVGGVGVVDVFKDEAGQIVHLLEGHVSGQVEVEVDWARRYDHMQQHTAQHLITALASDRYGWETISFHLGAEVCTIDLNTPSVPNEALAALEVAVNVEIRRAHAVHHKITTPDEMGALGVRTRGLPEGHTGQVRLVEIEGIDLNTCGGTHVASTGELQSVKLLGTSKIRKNTRLAYLAGGRVLDRLSDCLDREGAIGRLLASGPGDHVGLIEKLQQDHKAAVRRASALQSEVARFIGLELASKAEASVSHHRPGADATFLARVGSVLQEARPDVLALLTTGPAETGPGLFLIVGPPDKVKAAGPPVASLMEGRGGGRPGRFQGKVGDLSHREDAASLIDQIARG